MKKTSLIPVVALLAASLVAPGGTPARAEPPCATEVAGETAAQRMAADCATQVEVTSARTEYEQLFVQPDGTRTVHIAAVPQRVRRPDNSWADIDPTLTRRADGTVRPLATLADVTFSGGGTGPLVTLRTGGKRFALSWPGPLPAPVLAGDTATYRDVLPGIDLAVTATRAGYGHVLVVNTPEAARNPVLGRIRYTISGDLSPRRTAGGELELAGADGRATSFRSHAASGWDAGGPAKARPVRVDLAGRELLVVPDRTLLDSPAYPLVIDPGFEDWTPMFAYANTINSNWNVRDEAWVGRNPFDGTLYRSFFQFNISSLAGRRITSARFDIWLDHSAACAGNTAYLYRATPITATPRSAWGSMGLGQQLSSGWGDSNEANDSCGPDHFDDRVYMGGETFRADLHAATNSATPPATYTVGLCMCTNNSGANESGQYQWMRFFVASTVLVVGFNSYPGTPADLTTSGVACGGVVGTSSPVLRAKYADADDAQNSLTAKFEWKQLPSGAVSNVDGPVKPGNSFGEVALSLGAAAEGRSYSWRVQTNDGIDLSPWSGWCTFTVNASAPPLPGVSSTAYPEGATAHGGPGVSGSFTFSAGGTAGADVNTYVYGWTTPPGTTVSVAPGGSVTVTLTPPRHGYNTLYVYSKDPAATPGPIRQYRFLVGSPSAALAHWPLDTIANHGFSNQVGSAHLVVDPAATDVTWVPDARYYGAGAASFDAVAQTPTETRGVATATGTGLNTAGSFSVAAWVRFKAQPNCTNLVAVSIDGGSTNGFSLGVDCWAVRWRFAVPERDQHGTALISARSTSAPVAGRWTHLVGVWDEAEQKLQLYVDGVREDSVTPPAGWLANRGTGFTAPGPVVVGRGRYSGITDGTYFQGEIADVRLWNRVVVGDDLTGTNANPTAGTQATAGLLRPTEVGSWNFAGGADCGCGEAGDGSYFGRPMTLAGWDAPIPWSGFVFPGHDSDDAAWFNGTSGHATTAGPVVRTDQSLTVSAWVKLDAVADNDQFVLMQGGWPWWSMALNLSGSSDRWGFGISTPDGSGGFSWAWAQSNAVAVPNVWVHLVGVFDRATGQTRLYVNGVEQAAKGTGGVGWDGTSSLQVGSVWGSGGFLDGTVDQIKVYAGAMSTREVQNLYAAG